MKKQNLTALLVATMVLPASGVTVVSQAVEDGWLFNGTNRYEQILNNTGTNPNRWGAVRFDAAILSSSAFTDSALFTLNSATLTLVERTDRDANNGTMTGRVGAAFYDTATNSCLLYTSPSPRDGLLSRMPSSA